MKKLDINQLDGSDEELAKILISSGLSRPVARTLAYLQKVDTATSIDLEQGTGLRQPEVSIAMRELKPLDWIDESEEKKRNEQNAMVNWRFTTKDARIKLKRLYHN